MCAAEWEDTVEPTRLHAMPVCNLQQYQAASAWHDSTFQRTECFCTAPRDQNCTHAWQAAFKERDFNAGLHGSGRYDCAANLFWLNHRWVVSPKVPVNKTAVHNLKRRILHERKFEALITIAVDDTLNLDFGNLRRVSPEEIDHALILLVSDLIYQGADESELRRGPCQILYHLEGSGLIDALTLQTSLSWKHARGLTTMKCT